MYYTSSFSCYLCEAHLAAAAAQPIAALGALSQGAPVAAVIPFLGTLLHEKDKDTQHFKQCCSFIISISGILQFRYFTFFVFCPTVEREN